MGPRFANPKNAVTEVLTPTIVWTPLGISWTYTPGYVGLTGMRDILRSQIAIAHYVCSVVGSFPVPESGVLLCSTQAVINARKFVPPCM